MRRLVHAVVLLGALLSPGLAAAASALTLAPPKGNASYRRPDTVLRIHVPSDLSTDVLRQLHLELDNIDVTALVNRAGDYAVFRPLQPLAPGVHILRVVQIDNSGRETERGRWKFEVRQSATFHKLSGSADINLKTSVRFADKDLSDPKPHVLRAQGGTKLQGTADTGTWTAHGQADVVYDSQPDEGPAVQLGDYVVSIDHGRTGAAVGSQSIQQNSLLLQGFHSRGVTAHTSSADQSLRATGMLMQTRASADTANPIGISKTDDRMEGFLLEEHPLRDHDALSIAMAAVSGRYSPLSQGSSVVTPSQSGLTSTVGKGDALGIVVDSKLMNNRLALHGEAAHSRYTTDVNGGLPEDSDNAWTAQIDWQTHTSGAQPLTWSVGLLRSRIGTYFRTVTNPGLSPDRDLLSGHGSLQWHGWSAQLSDTSSTDNVNNIRILPTDRTRERNVVLGWTPVSAGKPSWLGSPSINLQYDRASQHPERVPAGYGGTPADQLTTGTGITANFSHNTWSWGASCRRDRFEDHTGASDNTVTDSYGLQASAIFRNRYTVAPYVAYQRTHDLSTDATSHTAAANLNIDAQLTDRLHGGMTYSKNNSYDPSNSQNQSDWTADVHMVWNWIPARTNHPGFDVEFSLMYEGLNDQVASSNNYGRWQGFASLAMTLPLRH